MQRRNVKGASAPAPLAGRGAGRSAGRSAVRTPAVRSFTKRRAAGGAIGAGSRVVQACCFLSSGVGGRMGSTDHSLGVLLPAPHHSRAGNDRCPCRAMPRFRPGRRAPDARHCGRIRAVAVSGPDSLVGEVASVSSVCSTCLAGVGWWPCGGGKAASTLPAPHIPRHTPRLHHRYDLILNKPCHYSVTAVSFCTLIMTLYISPALSLFFFFLFQALFGLSLS